VSTSFRYVAVQPSRIGDHRKLGKASYLLDFLTDHQTDAEGRVHYGQAVSYRWILANWHGNPDDRPSLRSLERHMSKIQELGLARIRVLGFGGGMIIRLVGSAKWQRELPPPAEQIPMFVQLPVSIRTRKSCGKPDFSTVSHYHIPPNMAVVDRQKWRDKAVKKYNEEKDTAGSRPATGEPVEKTEAELQERLRLLRDQAEMLTEKFKRAG
jgi:hypothetical protein